MTGAPTQRSGLGKPTAIVLPPLELGRHYALDVWLQDSHGAEGKHVRRADVFREGNEQPWSCDLERLVYPGGYQFLHLTMVVHGVPVFIGSACDSDGDTMQAFAELQPAGAPLTGTPTYSMDVPTNPRWPGYGDVSLRLADVQVGQHYQFSFWLRDAYGRQSIPIVIPDLSRDQ